MPRSLMGDRAVQLTEALHRRSRVAQARDPARHLDRRRLRPMPDALVAARVVIESVAWFAWHRREGRDSALYDDQAARRTVVEFACAALVPETAPAGAQPHADAAHHRQV